ncbi:MAG TPA: carbamoyltransferase C-terminal domain-containing protein [Pseudonocardiaceae bacterium]|jgi:hydroxymethyl cephem carbamoyltransferase
MLIAAVKPGHDGSIALLADHRLVHNIEQEKDSLPRYGELTGLRLLELMAIADRPPDVLAVGGWLKGAGRAEIGAGYLGVDAVTSGVTKLFGHEMRYFSSSHERSHIMMAMGMAPGPTPPRTAVLVWEGHLGAFYVVDADWRVVEKINVMEQPGDRYALLFDIADPSFAEPRYPRLGSSGKLMALAAYGDAGDASAAVVQSVARILTPSGRRISTATKWEFVDSPLFNAGVEAQVTKDAAALLSRRLFDAFADAARRSLPPGLPLRVSGGCGLNCEWNRRWRDLGHFCSVFVPPCTNDSGSAIGTAVDAAHFFTGNGTIDWNVYTGLDFDLDVVPAGAWRKAPYDLTEIAGAILAGRVTAWVQGAWELGPRALGNRSLLATPFDRSSHDVLNRIKQREGYRPIAPSCRSEDLHLVFDETFDDPYMLYFRRVTSPLIPAVTHVDGTARVQTVRQAENPRFHELLTRVAAVRGVGILCNTSLNWPGHGFINRMSDLLKYCEKRGVDQIVVGTERYVR